MALDPGIIERGIRPHKEGSAFLQGFQTGQQLKLQREQNERSNRLLQLREQQFAQEETDRQKMEAKRDFALTYRGVLKSMIQSGSHDQVVNELRRKQGSAPDEQKQFWGEAIEQYQNNPQIASRMFEQAENQAVVEKLIGAPPERDRVTVIDNGVEKQAFKTREGFFLDTETNERMPKAKEVIRQRGIQPRSRMVKAVGPGGKTYNLPMNPDGTPDWANATLAPETPEQQAKVTAAKTKAKVGTELKEKRAFTMENVMEDIQRAEDILTGEKTGTEPTESILGAVVDFGGSVIGVSPPGAEEAAKLEVIGGGLIGKVPRFEGPQSDKDVALYKQMAGKIGDRTVPTEERLAALETLKEIMGRYDENFKAKKDAVNTPITREDYDALPSGAVYRDPDDGKLYRKP